MEPKKYLGINMSRYDFKIGNEIVELSMTITKYSEYQKSGKVEYNGKIVNAERVWGNESPPNLNFVGNWFVNGKDY